MGDFYSASDVVITRGGSNVLFELLALKKPMLIIPLQKGSRGDQVENAQEFKDKNFAKVLPEDELTQNNSLLLNNLDDLYKNKQFYINNMSSQKQLGTQKIIAEIEKVLSN